MNDKINELAVKATLKHFPSFDNVVLYGDYTKSSYNKEIEDMMLVFAELIVKECVNICETACLPIDVNLWRDMTKLAMSAYTARALAEEIKKHFGVE